MTAKVIRSFRRPTRVSDPPPVQEVLADREQITVRTTYSGGAYLKMTMNWAFFDAFTVEDDAIFGMRQGEPALCVPARAARSAEEWNAFCHRVTEYWRESCGR